MKGLEHSLVIIVTAIVLLITAIVIITIFGAGVGNVQPFLTQKNLCLQQAAISCRTTGAMPPNWETRFEVTLPDGTTDRDSSCLKVTGGITSCQQVTGQPAAQPPPGRPGGQV
jgi:hypothetical protein